MRKTLIRPTDAEDAIITAAALADPDNPPLDAVALAKMKRKGGRPAGSNKELISIRIDSNVLDAFKSGGPGWQKRINEVLKDWTRQHLL